MFRRHVAWGGAEREFGIKPCGPAISETGGVAVVVVIFVVAATAVVAMRTSQDGQVDDIFGEVDA